LLEMADQHFKFGRQKPADDPRSAPSCAEIEVDGVGNFAITQVATVGRAPECQVYLNVRSVSRNHARVFFEGGHFWVKDLESANGTTVNGKKVRLQMLADGDKLCFGEVKAQFRCGTRTTGPALLAEDPLAGTEQPVPDGTPTGGLGEPPRPPTRSQPARSGDLTMAVPEPDVIGKDSQLKSLTRKVESLQAENERLRGEICQMRTTLRGTGSTTAQQPDGHEVDRLRRLVGQLERALADSNLRIRNLQERLDRGR
jgi:predicted component of type VI protein secretion system